MCIYCVFVAYISTTYIYYAQGKKNGLIKKCNLMEKSSTGEKVVMGKRLCPCAMHT